MTECSKVYSEKRTVKWGDCDPDSVIYTPRVYEYSVDALESFARVVLGTTWFQAKQKRNFGTPMVRSEIDYLAPLRPDMEIQVDVQVQRIGRSALTYQSIGSDKNGKHYFRVMLTQCFITMPEFKPVPIPEDIRAILVAYQAGCS
jgi:acyl-CoA thioesterase FadM